MGITPLHSEPQELKSTSVKGDPHKIEAAKKLGHGMLSHAFRVGLDVVLGVSADDIQQLEADRKSTEEQIKILQAKLELITDQLKNVKAFDEQKQAAIALDNEQVEEAVSEYIRCAPKIIYNRSTQLTEHLSKQLSWTTQSGVRAFFANRSSEPTEEEIREFLKRR